MSYEPTKQDTKEFYTRVWTNYAVAHLSQEQLASLFDCSVDTIANAIKWGANNRTQMPSPVVMEAAKEALESRIRELKNDLVRIKEGTPINWNAVIGMNKLIKENEELLWKLEGVIQDKSVITINSNQVNQVLKARDEIIEGMSQDERQKIISRIREVTGEQVDRQENA